MKQPSSILNKLSGPVRISVEGPPYTGTNIIGERFSEALGLVHLDIYRIYRALAAKLNSAKVNKDDLRASRELLTGFHLTDLIGINAIKKELDVFSFKLMEDEEVSRFVENSIETYLRSDWIVENGFVLTGYDTTSRFLDPIEHKFYFTATRDQRACFYREYWNIDKVDSEFDDLIDPILQLDKIWVEKESPSFSDHHIVDVTRLSLDAAFAAIVQIIDQNLDNTKIDRARTGKPDFELATSAASLAALVLVEALEEAIRYRDDHSNSKNRPDLILHDNDEYVEVMKSMVVELKAIRELLSATKPDKEKERKHLKSFSFYAHRFLDTLAENAGRGAALMISASMMYFLSQIGGDESLLTKVRVFVSSR